jgi:hypothetical protein
VAAAIAADIGGLAIAVGGVLTFTAGLVVIAAVLGIAAGWLARDAGRSPDGRQDRILAVVLAIGGVTLGQVLLWFVALLEGGVLGPIDYLAQTFGILVPAQFFLAGAGAWLASR